METMTVKRNGVFIVFPKMENAPIKGDAFGERRPNVNAVEVSKRKKQLRSVVTSIKQIVRKKKETRRTKASVKCKKCIWCNEPVFYGSPYCWEHYKYEHFESK